MSAETQKVYPCSALGVIDRAVTVLDENGLGVMASNLREARAAVAELIEAAKEASGWVDQVSVAGCNASDRLDEALARIGFAS